MSISTPQLDLPDHLVISIFEYLPVKSLLKFRRVSKTICSLIYKSSFISAHLKHSTVSDSNKRSNVLQHLIVLSDLTRFSLYNETADSLSVVSDLFSDQKIHGAVACCNGVVCMFGSDFKSLYFWNPLINKSVKQTIENPLSPSSIICVGFGYDHSNNQFKFVHVFKDKGTDMINPFAAKLYRISGTGDTNTWRVSSIPPPQEYTRYDDFCLSVYVSGALHWLGISRDLDMHFPSYILSFNMKDEVFQKLALPRIYYLASQKDHIQVLEYNGMLCVLPYWFNIRYTFSIWVMKEYGNVESWIPLFDIRLRVPIHFQSFTFQVVGWKNNGEELWGLIANRPGLHVFDQKTLKFRENKMVPRCHQLFCGTYTESLALMNADVDVEDENHLLLC